MTRGCKKTEELAEEKRGRQTGGVLKERIKKKKRMKANWGWKKLQERVRNG